MKIGFWGIVCVVLLSSCSTLLSYGATSAVNSISSSQAKSAYTKVVATASEELLKRIPTGSKVWVNNRATGSEVATANDIGDDLISMMLDNDRIPIDRENAALIAQEQNLQLSGNVREEDIMRIGNQMGAQYLVTLNINVTNQGTTTVRRLQMRLLNIETAGLLMQSDTSDKWLLR